MMEFATSENGLVDRCRSFVFTGLHTARSNTYASLDDSLSKPKKEAVDGHRCSCDMCLNMCEGAIILADDPPWFFDCPVP